MHSCSFTPFSRVPISARSAASPITFATVSSRRSMPPFLTKVRRRDITSVARVIWVAALLTTARSFDSEIICGLQHNTSCRKIVACRCKRLAYLMGEGGGHLPHLSKARGMRQLALALTYPPLGVPLYGKVTDDLQGPDDLARDVENRRYRQ